MKKGSIRVIIVDDHVMVRSGLRLFFARIRRPETGR